MQNNNEPLLRDEAHCESTLIMIIIIIASTKCKIKKQQTAFTETFFFVLDITYRLMIMMAGVPIPQITISKYRLFCWVRYVVRSCFSLLRSALENGAVYALIEIVCICVLH